VANRGDGDGLWARLGWLWAMVAAVFVVGASTLGYLFYRYTLSDTEIVIRDGIFKRNERHIPFSRIQNIDLVQNPLHRALGVALVRVETGSGGAPEAEIRVLSLAAIDRMRARIFVGRAGAEAVLPEAPAEAEEASPAPGGPRQILAPLPTSELAKLGIVSNKGMVVLGAAMGVFWQRQWEFDWFDQAKEYFGTGREWLGTVFGSPIVGVVAAGAGILLVGLVLLRLFSIGWYIYLLHGFTLTRVGDDLRAEYGLFNKISRTVPTPRIQALSTQESPLHRVFGRQSVKLQTVGGGAAAGAGQAGIMKDSQWLAPMIEPERVPELFAEVHEGVDLRAISWEPIAQRAWWRLFRPLTAVGAVVALVAAFFVGFWALLLAALVALGAFFHARAWVKSAAYSLAPWGLVFKSGWFNRTLKLVRYSKIQTVSQKESPFDRRNGMATVRIDTAGAGAMGHTIEIPFLDAAVAGDVAHRLYEESSRHAFRW